MSHQQQIINPSDYEKLINKEINKYKDQLKLYLNPKGFTLIINYLNNLNINFDLIKNFFETSEIIYNNKENLFTYQNLKNLSKYLLNDEFRNYLYQLFLCIKNSQVSQKYHFIFLCIFFGIKIENLYLDFEEYKNVEDNCLILYKIFYAIMSYIYFKKMLENWTLLHSLNINDLNEYLGKGNYNCNQYFQYQFNLSKINFKIEKKYYYYLHEEQMEKIKLENDIKNELNKFENFITNKDKNINFSLNEFENKQKYLLKLLYKC